MNLARVLITGCIIISVNFIYSQAIIVNGIGLTSPSTGGSPTSCNGDYKFKNAGVPPPTINSNCVVLTDGTAVDGEGDIWICDPLDLTNDFNLTFTANFGTNLGSGDGIAFVLNGNNDAPLGGVGGNIGYNSIQNSVAVEFDTWPDVDVNCHHAEINNDGLNNQLSAPIPLKSCCGSVVDGGDYDICITWEVSTGTSGTLTGTFNGNVIGSYTGDLAILLGGNANPNWGFTSGCGAGGGQIQTICNVNMDNQSSTLSNCATCVSPSVSASPTFETICSGELTNITITGNPGTEYCWQASDNLNVNGESSNLQSETSDSFILSEVLTNGVPGTQTVIYNVYPFNNQGCIGAPLSITVTVLDANDPLCNCAQPNLILDAAFTNNVCSPDVIDIYNAIDGASDLMGNTLSYYENLTDAQNGTNDISNVVSTSGTYYIRLESGSDPNCYSIEAISIIINPIPTISGPSELCFGGPSNSSIDLTGTGIPNSPIAWVIIGGTGSGNLSNIDNNVVTLTSSASGTLDIEYSDNNGCTSTTSILINEAPSPSISINQNPSNCNISDGAIDICGLLPSTTYNLSYEDGSGPITFGSFSTDPSGCYALMGLAADLYSNFEVTYLGCTGSDLSAITLTNPNEPTPTVSLESGITSCVSSDGIINICGLQPSTSYSDLDYLNDNGIQSVGSFITDANGCYQVTGLSASTYSMFNVTLGGCQGIDSSAISITEPVSPTVTINLISPISCNGESDGAIQAIASGGSTPYSYAWSPTGGLSDLVSNLGPGNYIVSVTDDASCVGTASIELNEPEPILISGTISDANCGQSDGAIVLSVSGGTPNYSYLWSPSNAVTDELTNIDEGDYLVTVTDNNGCVYSESFSVLEGATIPINASPSVESILSGESVQLSVTGASSYVWSPSEGLSCTECLNPIASPNVSTTYTVVGTDDSGCIGIDTVQIIVSFDCAEMYIPNILAPNSAELQNRIICVFGDCIAELSFRIYNRWGQKVFETMTSMNQNNEALLNEICWDGTQNGKDLQTGVYVYSLYAKMDNGDVVNRSGNITIVR